MHTTHRLLVVEDEAIVAAHLSECLERFGYEVVGTAASATEAIQIVKEQRPDLVLMDIRIQGDRDGVEAAQELFRDHDQSVIFLTAHTDPATLSRAREAQPLGYIVKPFVEREVAAVVETCLHRVQAERRLRRMERWQRTLLDSMGDAVVATDREARVTYLNPRAVALTGWTRDGAAGLPLDEVLVPAMADADEGFGRLARSVIEHGRPITVDTPIAVRSRSGRGYLVEDSIAPVLDHHQEVAGSVLIFRDVSARVELERQQRDLDRQLIERQRTESLGSLSAGLAHDLNNLLTVVLGNADLIAFGDSVSAETAARLNEIRSVVGRASHLCAQMQNYAGNGPYREDNLDPGQWMRETVEFFQHSRKHRRPLKVEIGEELPRLRGDSGQLQQVLLNLLINAAEACAENNGDISLRISRQTFHSSWLRMLPGAPHLPTGEYLALDVIDTGPGMGAETLKRIFDPFFSTKFAGRGLGLAAVQGIVRTHGGAIDVESKPGAGARFTVLLPTWPNPSANAGGSIPGQ
jgi:two-component system, cell cycle sensor histidine kinase and response regulator CckA